MASKELKEVDETTRRHLFRYSPKFPVIDGVRYLPGTIREYLQEIKNLPVKGDEVFVATYPRSGTTWTSEIVWQIFSDGTQDTRPLRQRVPFIESLIPFGKVNSTEQLVDFFSDKPSPRVFKTHLQYPLVPMGDGVTRPKYINVIRNPKDSTVSYYHHEKGFIANDFDGPWEEYFELFMEAEVLIEGTLPFVISLPLNCGKTVEFGSWFDHVLGWWAHRDDPNILILKYEDMKKDLPSAVKQIAKFVGKDLTEETIQLIVKQTSFEAMSKGDGRFNDGDEEFRSKLFKPNAEKFMRKGEVGDWKNYFTEEQNRRFDELYEKKMAGRGLELEFS